MLETGADDITLNIIIRSNDQWKESLELIFNTTISLVQLYFRPDKISTK